MYFHANHVTIVTPDIMATQSFNGSAGGSGAGGGGGGGSWGGSNACGACAAQPPPVYNPQHEQRQPPAVHVPPRQQPHVVERAVTWSESLLSQHQSTSPQHSVSTQPTPRPSEQRADVASEAASMSDSSFVAVATVPPPQPQPQQQQQPPVFERPQHEQRRGATEAESRRAAAQDAYVHEVYGHEVYGHEARSAESAWTPRERPAWFHPPASAASVPSRATLAASGHERQGRTPVNLKI